MPQGGTTTLAVPPAPGLQARLSGDSVVVSIDTGHSPRACHPTAVRIVMDDDNAGFPPAVSTHALHALGRQTLSIAIPSSLQSTPTVIQAALQLRPQVRGPDARVTVTR